MQNCNHAGDYSLTITIHLHFQTLDFYYISAEQLFYYAHSRGCFSFYDTNPNTYIIYRYVQCMCSVAHCINYTVIVLGALWI